MKSNVRRIQQVSFRITEVEKNNLDDLIEKFGCNVPELIRQLIRDKHQKVFPGYIQVKKEKSEKQIYFESLESKSEIELCEILKGKPMKDEGLNVCKVDYFNRVGTRTGGYTLPLNKIHLIDAIKKQ